MPRIRARDAFWSAKVAARLDVQKEDAVRVVEEGGELVGLAGRRPAPGSPRGARPLDTLAAPALQEPEDLLRGALRSRHRAPASPRLVATG